MLQVLQGQGPLWIPDPGTHKELCFLLSSFPFFPLYFPEPLQAQMLCKDQRTQS